MDKAEILLIEDDLGWQRELKMSLEVAGYEVSVFATYDSAVNALEQHSAKAAVVDVSLIPNDASDRQGLLIMKKAHIPIVCVSGYLKPGEVGKLFHKELAGWFFDKETLWDEEADFLEAVAGAVAKYESESRKKWKKIERSVRTSE